MPDNFEDLPPALVTLTAAALQGILSNPELCSGELELEAIAEDAVQAAKHAMRKIRKMAPPP